MQKIEHMPDEEIIKLTDDDLDKMVKLRMAERGVRFLDFPTEPEYATVEGPDLTIFGVEGMYFDNYGSAESVASAINGQSDYRVNKEYSYNVGYDKYYATDYEGRQTDVSTIAVYSESRFNSVRDVLKDNEQLKSNYKEAKSEYEKHAGDRREIHEEIYGHYLDADLRLKKIDTLVTLLKEYIEVADGNYTIGLNFLLKAYEENLDDVTLTKVERKYSELYGSKAKAVPAAKVMDAPWEEEDERD